MRNYLIVLVGRHSEEAAYAELRGLLTHFVTTTESDIFVTRYQPHRKPGNWRYMAVARVALPDAGSFPFLPSAEMHFIAVD